VSFWLQKEVTTAASKAGRPEEPRYFIYAPVDLRSRELIAKTIS
jgi:hypothetical protein